jgi:hypothetical protein
VSCRNRQQKHHRELLRDLRGLSGVKRVTFENSGRHPRVTVELLDGRTVVHSVPNSPGDQRAHANTFNFIRRDLAV